MTAATDLSKARGLWFGACKEAGLDEDARRDVQLRICGKDSAKAMTVRDFNKCVMDLKERGLWKPKRPARTASGKPHVRKIWAIWRDMAASGLLADPSDAALRAFVQRQVKITDPEWLSPDQANKVTEGLKAWRARELAKRTQADN